MTTIPFSASRSLYSSGPIRRVGLLCAIFWMLNFYSMSAPVPGVEKHGDHVMIAFPSYLIDSRLPDELKALEERGRLTDAEQWIAKSIASNPADERWYKTMTQEQERLRRLRRDFSLSSKEMLEKLDGSIPGTTVEDLDRWRERGEIQWVMIDGQPRYFRREPVNLFRFCKEAAARRDATKLRSTTAATTATAAAVRKDDQESAFNQHLSEAIDQAQLTGYPTVCPTRTRVRFEINVKPGVVPEGKKIRCWIPYPQDYRQQGELDLVATTPTQPLIAPNGSAHRTLYFEQFAARNGQPTTFAAEYVFTCSAFVPAINPDQVEEFKPDDPIVREFCAERPPHVVFSPELKKLAAEIVGDEKNPYRKAEKIFRWIDGNIKYAAEMEYTIIPNITAKILATRKGDCGVQVLLFMSLCRAVGVPARWQSGWESKPGASNMHDWAEFYIRPYGWLPADPSYGLRDSDNPKVRDFFIGHMDAYRMIANLDFERPFDPSEKFWRCDPVDSQRGEVQWEGGNLYYDQWDYRVEIVDVSKSAGK